jgi:virginiamycin B lyase
MLFRFSIFFALIVGVGLLSGCGSEEPGPVPTAILTLQPTSEPSAVNETAIPAEPTPDLSPGLTVTSVTAVPLSTSEPTITVQPTLVTPVVQGYEVPPGSRPHDVAPAPDGSVWYTAQGTSELGRLDPDTGTTVSVPGQRLMG